MSKKILIAEDEKPMAKALKTKFESKGYEVTNAFDGEEALSCLSKSKYDLLLLDLMMPKKDGFAVMEELKTKKNKTPIIVSTNLSQPQDEERAKKLGAKDYFVKSDTPITEVVSIVEKILGK